MKRNTANKKLMSSTREECDEGERLKMTWGIFQMPGRVGRRAGASFTKKNAVCECMFVWTSSKKNKRRVQGEGVGWNHSSMMGRMMFIFSILCILLRWGFICHLMLCWAPMPTACSCLCCCQHDMAWHRQGKDMMHAIAAETRWACVAGAVRGWSFF